MISQITTKKSLREVINYTGDDWKQYVRINPHQYNKLRIFNNDFFDMYVITWNTNQKSPIHDHSQNGCCFKVLKGHITEHIYDKNMECIGKNNLKKGDMGSIHNSKGYHSIMNAGDVISVTLHVYSPPGYKANIFS